MREEGGAKLFLRSFVVIDALAHVIFFIEMEDHRLRLKISKKSKNAILVRLLATNGTFQSPSLHNGVVLSLCGMSCARV